MVEKAVGFTDVSRRSGKNVKRRVTGRNSTPRGAQGDPDVWQLQGEGSLGEGRGGKRAGTRGLSRNKLPKVSLLVAKRLVNTSPRESRPFVTHVSWVLIRKGRTAVTGRRPEEETLTR